MLFQKDICQLKKYRRVNIVASTLSVSLPHTYRHGETGERKGVVTAGSIQKKKGAKEENEVETEGVGEGRKAKRGEMRKKMRVAALCGYGEKSEEKIEGKV